jgi:hypothetical protein
MAEMPLAEHDNVVKTFPPDRTDRPFTISVLPRRSRRGWPIPNAHRTRAADEDVTVDGVAVTNDVSRRYFPTIGCQIASKCAPLFAAKNDPFDGAETGGAAPHIAEQSRSWRAASGERAVMRGS